MFKAVFGLADVKECKLETVAVKWNGQYCLVLQPSQGKRANVSSAAAKARGGGC